MDDEQIIALFFERNERAVQALANRYGSYGHAVLMRILRNHEDTEECWNDVLLKIWNAIPPAHPDHLRAFLAAVARNEALSRFRRQNAEKRGGGQTEAALDELLECVPATDPAARRIDDLALDQALNHFLTSLKPETRRIFLQRYWYVCSVKEIARGAGVSEGKIKMILLRARRALKEILEKEGIAL